MNARAHITKQKPTIHDVIVVGAGAGGTTAAALLAREGFSALLLDKTPSARDTVRSDGLMPQAVYWLDKLGCADAVLAEARGCIHGCDLFVDGRKLLTGHFPDDTAYPGFAILIVRGRFDQIMLQHAIACGAEHRSHTIVRGLAWETDHVRVLAEYNREPVEYRARLVIGADGSSSIVSRAIGNTLKDGVLGLSVRTTYKDVDCDGAGIRVYFNRDYFPSYGWLFIDEHRTACVGLGCAMDKKFPAADNLSAGLHRFIETDLAKTLAYATRIGPFSGGISSYYRPNMISTDRVMLIGDAANLADPLNRGGIHTAMESAFCAVEAGRAALAADDFSRASLKRYEALWSARFEADWRTSEIFMSLAKNPALRDLSLFLLKQVGELTVADPRFGTFASGIFSGVVSQSSWLSPSALYHAFPKDPETWLALARSHGRLSGRGAVAGTLRLVAGTLAHGAKAGANLARTPGITLDWSMDTATKALRLAERQLSAASPTKALS